MGICTGQTSNEFPAFANTRTLYAIKPKTMKILTILLDAQSNPLAPFITLLGFAIAMIWLFARKSKKDNDDKNKMQ